MHEGGIVAGDVLPQIRSSNVHEVDDDHDLALVEIIAEMA